MNKLILGVLASLSLLLVSVAASPIPTAMPSPGPTMKVVNSAAIIVSEPTMSLDQFLALVLEKMKGFGGIPWTLKIAAILMILLGTLKVSFARPVWDKLGPYKALAAPVLSLLIGIVSLGANPNQMITGPGVVAYLFAGAGAIVLHELIDAIKSIPGIGPTYLNILVFMQTFLKKPGGPTPLTPEQQAQQV